MASTSSSIEICQELNDFFSWNPPRLIRAPLPPGKKESTKTPQPAFFDKHLSDRLLLKHVKRLPSLVRDIANTVDNAIATRRIPLPPAGNSILTSEQRKDDLAQIPHKVVDEKSVAIYYDKTAGRWCPRVASTLAFPSTRWTSVIMWSQSGNYSGYAIADGMLQFIGDDMLSVQEALSTMDKETLRLYHALCKQFPNLATWEFKSPAAGPEDTMLAIPDLSNKGLFAWTMCTEPNCGSDPRHIKEREKVAQIRARPDANLPLWTLLDESPNTQDSRDEETTKTAPPPALPQPSPEKRRRSTRIKPAASQATGSMPPPPVPAARPEGAVSRTDPKGKRKRDTGDEAFKGPEDVSAQFILQQVKHFPFSPDNCSVMLTEHAFRHGRRLYCRIRPSLYSIQGITKSFVFASGALRRCMFLTVSSRTPVRILRMGSFMSGYTSLPSKMPRIG
jgi:hypothetical protein